MIDPSEYEDKDSYLYDVARDLLYEGRILQKNIDTVQGSSKIRLIADSETIFELTQSYMDTVAMLCRFLQRSHPVFTIIEKLEERIKALDGMLDIQHNNNKDILASSYQLALKLEAQEREIARLNGIIELSSLITEQPTRPKRDQS